MPTPTYQPQLAAKPDPADDGTDIPANAKQNDNALADELGQFGMLGWNETNTIVGGQVTQTIAARGARRTRIDYTYVPSGPAAGSVDTETHYWSNDSGATWTLRTDSASSVSAGVLTYSYDGSGNCTGATWS